MNKLKILFIIGTTIIIVLVGLLTLKNYYPDNAISMKAFPDNKYSSKNQVLKYEMPSMPSEITVTRIEPKDSDTKVENLSEPRILDDVIKITETFSPLVVPFITFYIYKKKKKIDNNVKAEDDE